MKTKSDGVFMRIWRSPKLLRVWIFCDGCTGAGNGAGSPPAMMEAAGRPGQLAMGCGAGAAAFSDAGEVLAWECQRLPAMTNNEAEYAGLLLGLTLGRRLRAAETNCVLDSATVVRQMQGRAAVKSRALRQWHWRACEAARDVPNLRLRLIPREWNRLADGLAAQAGMTWEEMRAALAGIE
jgi:ribonuclease HI